MEARRAVTHIAEQYCHLRIVAWALMEHATELPLNRLHISPPFVYVSCEWRNGVTMSYGTDSDQLGTT